MGKALGEVKNPPLKHNNIYLESPFGKRKYNGKIEQHNGIDVQYRYPTTKLKDNKADTIISIGSGIVKKVTYSSSRGYYIEIKHNEDYVSRYLHCKKGSILVKVGQAVSKGTPLATTGMTGAADGVHLHLAIELRGIYIDPLPYILGELDVDTLYFKKGATLELLFDKYLRTSAKVSLNKALWKNLTPTAKAKTHKVKNGYARYNIGARVKIKEVKYDSKGYTWIRTGSLWFCALDNTGLQVKKI